MLEKKGVEWAFRDKFLTAWGRLRIIEELLRKIRFKEVLGEAQLPEPKSNRGYNSIEVLENFLVTVWIGGSRFSHTAMVRFDEALKGIFGWKKVSCVSSFTRFFKRFGRLEVDRVFGHINRWFCNEVNPITVTLDLDSTIITRFGQQEGSYVGYNP